MNCKELRAIREHKLPVSPSMMISDATEHIETCDKCRSLLILDKLAPAIIRAACNSDCETILSSALINRIKNRIQEMREYHSTSWELAIDSTRGWLAAFALAAVALIAISIQWQPSVITTDFDHDDDELTTQNPAEYLISDIPDPVGAVPIGKDTPYAHR